MDADLLDKICKQVYARAPEVDGERPKVQSQGDGNSYLLVFKGSAKTANGKSLQRIIRVVASSSGKIIKLTSSK